MTFKSTKNFEKIKPTLRNHSAKIQHSALPKFSHLVVATLLPSIQVHFARPLLIQHRHGLHPYEVHHHPLAQFPRGISFVRRIPKRVHVHHEGVLKKENVKGCAQVDDDF